MPDVTKISKIKVGSNIYDVIDTTYSNGAGLNLANNQFSLKTATDTEIGGVKIEWNSTTGELNIKTN